VGDGSAFGSAPECACGVSTAKVRVGGAPVVFSGRHTEGAVGVGGEGRGSDRQAGAAGESLDHVDSLPRHRAAVLSDQPTADEHSVAAGHGAARGPIGERPDHGAVAATGAVGARAARQGERPGAEPE
jgi:hypothetical protein